MSDSDGEAMDYAPNQVLPVANLPMNFDGVPQDGLEYLFTVRRDSKLLPRFTRVPNPYEVQEAPIRAPAAASMLKETDGSTEDASSSMTMPSDEWKQAFLQNFRNYRANLQQAIQKSRADKSTTVVRNDGKKGVSDRNDAGWMPGFNNRDNWWRFITGTTVVPTATNSKALRNEKEGVLVVESGIEKEHGKEEALEGGDIGDAEEADNDERDGEEESDEEERQMEVESPSVLPTIDDVVWESSDKGKLKAANITRSTAIIDIARNDAGDSASFGPGDTAHEPTLAILKRLSTRNIVQLLYWHSAWIDAYVDALEEEVEEQEQEQEGNKKKRELALSRRPKEVHQQWMFTLLGVLEDSRVSHDISSLRTLARACLRLVCVARRLKMGEWVEWVLQEGNAETGSTMSIRMGGFWMVIAAVVGIWGQHDLWDEARVQMRMAAATG
ncbi:hypothetical protein FRB91_011869 [Serendipita sp. 411]|nr:hypothetical protein FRB91_011869 [Serendipita sp. 411]